VPAPNERFATPAIARGAGQRHGAVPVTTRKHDGAASASAGLRFAKSAHLTIDGGRGEKRSWRQRLLGWAAAASSPTRSSDARAARHEANVAAAGTRRSRLATALASNASGSNRFARLLSGRAGVGVDDQALD